MNLANMAAARAPWTGSGPVVAGADLSLQLAFALQGPVEAEPPAALPTAWSWTSEPRDSARHGAELAALLVSLQPVESDFLPLLAEAPPPALEEMPPWPLIPPAPGAQPPEGAPPPPAILPPPDWLML